MKGEGGVSGGGGLGVNLGVFTATNVKDLDQLTADGGGGRGRRGEGRKGDKW